MDKKDNKLEWITSLRGLAAILVFISHLTILPLSRGILFVVGRIGVVCFFMISGYLTIVSRSTKNTFQYVWNRIIRIYPIYWIILGVMFVLYYDDFSIKQLLANITLFQEFLGFNNIVGPSWMLPIQLVFYFVVAVIGIKKNARIRLCDFKMIFIFQIIWTCMSIILSICRYYLGKPFPTAMFLLIGVANLGIVIYIENTNLKHIYLCIGIFEVGLLVSAPLSYGNDSILYYISYNVGVLIFAFFGKRRVCSSDNNSLLAFFSKISYPFFLGFDIPYRIILKYEDVFDGWRCLIAVIIQLMTMIFIGYIINRFIEDPLINRAKVIERKL